MQEQICPKCGEHFYNLNLYGNKKEIINLLKKRSMNITELTNKLGIAYKNCWKHVEELNQAKIIKIKKDWKKLGQPVMVSLK